MPAVSGVPINPAWLAGFIDGEGSVTLVWKWAENPERRATLVPAVGISNTRIDILREIQREYGGSLQVLCRKPQHKPNGYLALQYNRAYKILRAVRPYLKLKTQQADIVLAYETMAKFQSSGRMRAEVQTTNHDGITRRGRRWINTIPETEITKRREMRDTIRALNKRGA